MSTGLKALWQRNRRIFSNVFSLSVMQGANYLMPLITLPYLVRVLGPSRYGLVELARAISMYFVVLTEYGFNLSATRAISMHRNDRRRVSEIFSAVLVLKLILAIFSLAILTGMVLAIPKLRAEWLVCFFAFGTVVGQSLFPFWLFQGLERMKYIAVLTIIGKLVATVSIFLFIRRSDHYVYVPAVQSAGMLLMGVGGLVVSLRDLPVSLVWPSIAALRRELARGWHLFVVKMTSTLNTTSNAVILGLLTSNEFVAYYAAGERIVRAVQGLQFPLSQALFPHVGKLAAESQAEALAFVGRVVKWVSGATLIVSIALFAFAPFVSRVVLGEAFEASVLVIRILSPLPFVIGLSSFLGIQVMVNFGLKRTLTRIVVTAGVVNVALALPLALALEHRGVAIASLATETLIAGAMYVCLHRKGVHIFGTGNSAGADDDL
ncbi:MAG: flippase [Phycisphaerales bacterium]|nr:MAG: flippase [Phycisphaerales bacterium]